MYTIKLVQLHQKQNSLKQLKSELLKINDTTEQQARFSKSSYELVCIYILISTIF